MGAATLEAHGELVPELSDGLKELVGSAEQLDAAAQTGKRPFRPSRFRRRGWMRRQPGDWPSAARQHDRLTGAAHLVGDSAEVAARVDDRNALHHLNTGSVHFDFRPPQRGKLMNVGGEPPTSSPSPPRGELRPWSPGTHTGTRRRLTEPQPVDPLAALRSMCGIFRSRPPTGSAASPACSRTV